MTVLDENRDLLLPAWLWQVSRLWRLCLRLAKRVGLGVAYYRLSARTTAWFCSQRWIQERLFPVQTTLIRQFLTETGLSGADAPRVVQQGLVSYIWKLTAALPTLLEPTGDPRFSRRFEQVINVTGKQHIDQALVGDQGVLCVVIQFAFGHALDWWFVEQGICVATVQQGHPGDVPNSLFYARQLHQARHTLSQGGAVYMAPDGVVGEQGSAVPFLKRQRLFRHGFAELAWQTQAPIVPAAVYLDLTGTLHMTFFEPLLQSTGDSSGAVTQFVEQYVDYAREMWQTHPDNIHLPFLRIHLAQPEIEG